MIEVPVWVVIFWPIIGIISLAYICVKEFNEFDTEQAILCCSVGALAGLLIPIAICLKLTVNILFLRNK